MNTLSSLQMYIKKQCHDISLTEFKFNVFSRRMDFNEWNPFWASSFSVMAFLIIAGNSLTIATLLKKKFRMRPHFLLTSLAFADLLVGFVTILRLLLFFSYHSFTLGFCRSSVGYVRGFFFYLPLGCHFS